jgi:hypothetical protein
MSRVMISYRNIAGQREFAFDLEKELANAGIETWLDVKDIPRLSRWEDEIFKGIINSDYVVLCLSPDYFESETCLFECYVARGYRKTLFPVIVPYDAQKSVFDLVSDHEETRGIDSLNFLDFRTQSVLGLREDSTKLTQRLIKAIIDPTRPDIDYDVYFSFKASQSKFATQVGDDLNRAGIKAFIHTRCIDPGVELRPASWSAILRSKIHIVILSPDVIQSEFIKNELLVTRTKKNAQFIPILAQEFLNDEGMKSTIRQTFATSKNLSVLNEIQWVIPNGTYQDFIDSLIKDIKAILSRKEE